MPASKQKSTGKLLEWQTHDGALIANAIRHGHEEGDLEIAEIPLSDFLTQAKTINDFRREKIAEIKARRNSDISTTMGIEEEDVGMIKVIYQNTDPANHSAEMTASYGIWQYAAGKLNQVSSATQAQMDAYDVATDPQWPA